MNINYNQNLWRKNNLQLITIINSSFNKKHQICDYMTSGKHSSIVSVRTYKGKKLYKFLKKIEEDLFETINSPVKAGLDNEE